VVNGAFGANAAEEAYGVVDGFALGNNDGAAELDGIAVGARGGSGEGGNGGDKQAESESKTEHEASSCEVRKPAGNSSF
jgi:hypothetical protein